MSSELRSIRNRLAGLLRDVDALLTNEPATSAGVPVKDTAFEVYFAEFWKDYPLKVGKGGARAAYRVATKKAAYSTILAGLKAYKFNTDRKYLPHATTWLNQERWADEQAQPSKSSDPLDGLDDLFG